MTRYIIFHGRSIPITKDDDGLWRDPQGTIFAFGEASASSDSVVRCGVGPIFSLSPNYWMTPACAVHDYAYTSIAWQTFHSREQTDALLEKLGDEIPGHVASITPEVFEMLARIFGSSFWDVNQTNN